jgi:hypothetical protein
MPDAAFAPSQSTIVFHVFLIKKSHVKTFTTKKKGQIIAKGVEERTNEQVFCVLEVCDKRKVGCLFSCKMRGQNFLSVFMFNCELSVGKKRKIKIKY